MCGIFGIISQENIDIKDINELSRYSESRGKDSSGLFFYKDSRYHLYRSNSPLTRLVKSIDLSGVSFIIGHSRLVTNGFEDNQPIYREHICAIHNGIVVNDTDVWSKISKAPKQQIDSEVIPAISQAVLESGGSINDIANSTLELCEGIVACAVAIPRLGNIILFSNNGSLYVARKGDSICFASEKHILSELKCDDIIQVRENSQVFRIPASNEEPLVVEESTLCKNLIPGLGAHKKEESLLEYRANSLKRCTKCVLPETMPFIRFDELGVCNYCNNYKIRNKPRSVDELFELVKNYRRHGRDDCIVPFSGGRDSCYALHLIANELKMKPITYTYDWGMVTDLGRRNISRMCGKLKVENIVVADDIHRKRLNIAKNFQAWLKSPDLGMVSILTAGDKHFFRHIERIKRNTGIALNLWGINPLEVTHFKAGFLGVPPDFEEQGVYSSGVLKQLRYQWLRLNKMIDSPRYFNSSIWDTLSGEYYRSFHKKKDYFHIFDYWRWDESVIDNTLFDEYDWERAPDTNTTWRIGDGTAAIYNYIYYTVAGFSEHDTFRSNQIREGDITREHAIELVKDENRPRYPNIKWYLDAIGCDYVKSIDVINRIPKMY